MQQFNIPPTAPHPLPVQNRRCFICNFKTSRMQILQDRVMAFWPFVKVTGLNPKSALKSLLWVAARSACSHLFPLRTEPCSYKYETSGLINSQQCTIILKTALETFPALSTRTQIKTINSFHRQDALFKVQMPIIKNFVERRSRDSSVAIVTKLRAGQLRNCAISNCLVLNLTSHLHVMPKLRTRGAIPPLPPRLTMAFTGASLFPLGG